MYFNEKHNQIVISRGDNYKYICTYKCGEITIDGKCNKKCSYIRVKCPYCGTEYDIQLGYFKNDCKCSHCCNKYENSFAYHIQQELKEPLNKYWDWEKNTVNPYHIYKSTAKIKIYIKCTKVNYHDSYDIYPNSFYNGMRCGYCGNHKVHQLDSFGALYPSKAKYWSKNNDKTAFEVSPKSRDKYNFICEKCGEEFKRRLDSLNQNNHGVYCIDCNNSQLEEITKQVLQKYNIKYIPQKTYNNLLGLGNGNLSYDFYIPDYNLLIECQGEQHEHYCKGFHKTKKDFEKQLEHDKRKREYAKQHNIKLLEIWYYDIGNIEDILIKELNL